MIDEEPTIDMVNHPPHYQSSSGGIECIDAIEATLGLEGMIAFLRGQVIKYNWRLMNKGSPIENSQKAAWYQARLTVLLRKHY